MSWFPQFNRSALLQTGEKADRKGTVIQVDLYSLSKVPSLLNEITAFWFTHRTDQKIPDWRHFSPQTHTKFLPHIVLWEVIENSYLARITGETVAQKLPIKIANKWLHDVLTNDLSSLPSELERSVKNMMPIYVDRPNAWSLDDEIIHCQAVHLPFYANQDEVDRVLSVMIFDTELKIEV